MQFTLSFQNSFKPQKFVSFLLEVLTKLHCFLKTSIFVHSLRIFFFFFWDWEKHSCHLLKDWSRGLHLEGPTGGLAGEELKSQHRIQIVFSWGRECDTLFSSDFFLAVGFGTEPSSTLKDELANNLLTTQASCKIVWEKLVLPRTQLYLSWDYTWIQAILNSIQEIWLAYGSSLPFISCIHFPCSRTHLIHRWSEKTATKQSLLELHILQKNSHFNQQPRTVPVKC